MSYNSKYKSSEVEALLDKTVELNVVSVDSGVEVDDVETNTYVKYVVQTLTEEQKAQARKNIGAGSGTITGIKMNGTTKGSSGIVDLGTVITSHQDISGKQDVINDLDAIRSNAALGATALQSIPDEYVTVTELDGKVDKIEGKGLSTEDFTTILKQKLEGLSNYDDTAINQAVDKLRTDHDALVSGDTTTAIKTFNEVIAFLDGIQDTQDLSGIIASIEQQIAGKMDKVTLATVATSGSYNDLSNKPTIPDVSGKQDVLVSGTNIKTINGNSLLGNGNVQVGTYSKPSTGIPSTDLAQSVQTSLGKVDTAVQPAAIANMEVTTNKVTSISSSSTDTQYPSAKCVYDLIGDIETLLAAI